MVQIMTSLALSRAYLHCDRIASAEAGNFYWAFRFLPQPRRNGMLAVYAFARQADDLADLGADTGTAAAGVGDAGTWGAGGADPPDRLAKLRQLRSDLRRALAGETSGLHPAMAALADTVTRFSLTPEYLELILDGAERDLTVNRYVTFDALKDYCRLVASSVGLICLELFGCRQSQAKQMAENLGIALQLTNILRDVQEDAQRGRIYLPQEDLATTGCRESDILNGTPTVAFLRVCAINAARARQHYEMAYPLLTHLSAVARRTVAMMASLYARILVKIESGGFPVLERRVALSRLEKTFIFLSVLFNPTYPIPRTARPDLR
ncbi:MAG: hypothetical protein A3I06_08290 [Candidatus Lindowbacteria bacterium RIFCSPLOWO2_02_FULL_62_12]|nr:MAG: hypothetical protein A3I06_08290 [Candidatus Lindowbacteria bacterium RIFCSPLOWO2_02_FULL_62_12]